MSESHYTTKPEMILDTKYFMSQISRENPKELIIADRNISRISGLSDVPVINTLNISFNRLLESLDGIEQLPQLKELWGFACSIRDLSGLPSLTKLEILFLQHNRISTMNGMFQTLNRLKELRLDHNRIGKIQSLQNCLTLRKLDLSHNLLESIDGLSGLQSLQELNLSNNSINSISQLRGLPNLRELDVSHNHLKSLDGIQHLLKLEVVKADHNHMVHLALLPYVNNAVGSASQRIAATQAVITTTASNNNKSTTSNNKKETTTTNKSRKLFSSISTNVRDNNARISTTAAVAAPALPTLDRPILTELYLANNRLKTITNLEQYAHCLNILDISNNQMLEVEKLLEMVQSCSELNELRIFNNPFTTTTANNDQIRVLGKKNTKLMIIAEVVSDVNSLLLDSPTTTKLGKDNHGKDSPSVASSQFHTWERGRDDNFSIGGLSVSRGLFHRVDSTTQDSTQEDTKKDSKVEEKVEVEDEEEIIEKTINSMFITPMIVKDVLTQEQIDQRAQQFRHLLTTTKEELQASIFRFAIPEDEEETKPVNPYESERSASRTAILPVEKQQALSEKLITALDKALEVSAPAPAPVKQAIVDTDDDGNKKKQKSMMFSPSNSDFQPITTTTAPPAKDIAKAATTKNNTSKPKQQTKQEKASKERCSDALSPVSSKTSFFSSKLHSHINSQPHLETGLNTHGHKAFVSKVESEALQQAHAELASLLHSSRITVNDTDFSEIKITKAKKQANRFFLTPTGEVDGDAFDAATTVEVEEEAGVGQGIALTENPLMMSIEDRSYLQHLLTPRLDAPPPAMISTQHAVIYKPNSIGYDRRLVDDDDATVGSVPLQLIGSETIPSPSSRVIRAHSAPSIRPLTSNASRPQSSHGFGINAEDEGKTKVGAELQDGKKEKKSIVLASNGHQQGQGQSHSSSASTILRFNLPRAMQPETGTENQSPALFTDRWLSNIEDKILALSAKSGKPQLDQRNMARSNDKEGQMQED